MSYTILKITFEQTSGLPGQTKQSLLFNQLENGCFLAEYSFVNDDGESAKMHNQVSEGVIDQIKSLLSGISLPVFPQFERGRDGGFTQLEFGDYWGGAMYRWWSDSPVGWEALDAAVNKIVKLSGLDIDSDSSRIN